MRTIWKIKLKNQKDYKIKLPEGSKFLTIKHIGKYAYAFFEVDPKKQKEEFFVRFFSTGDPIEDDFNGKYLDSCRLASHLSYFHYYLVKPS